MAEYPWLSSSIYQVVNSTIQDIVAASSPDVFVKSGKNVSFYMYPLDKKDSYKLFVIRNDWFSQDKKTSCVLSVFGKEKKLKQFILNQPPRQQNHRNIRWKINNLIKITLK